jgi:hypothetical protein
LLAAPERSAGSGRAASKKCRFSISGGKHSPTPWTRSAPRNSSTASKERAGYNRRPAQQGQGRAVQPAAGGLIPCFESQMQEMQKMQKSIPTDVARHRRCLFLQFLQFLHPHPRPTQMGRRVTASTSPTSSTAAPRSARGAARDGPSLQHGWSGRAPSQEPPLAPGLAARPSGRRTRRPVL